MTSTKSKLEFTHAMARHTRATVRQCEALMRYAATLQRLAEDDCNLDDGEAGQLRRSEKRRRIQRKVTGVCKGASSYHLDTCYGGLDCACPINATDLQPIFSSYPRGAVLKIRVPDGYTNDWGKEGIVVPS